MVGRHVVVAGVDVVDLLRGRSGRHRPAPSTRRRRATPVRSDMLQRNQPDGVPPLALTGERTLPDVPAENYWYPPPPGRLRVDRRSGSAACAWSTWPAARATARTCSPRRRRSVVGVDANPEAHEHARLRYVRPNLRFERDLVETLRRARRRGRLPADDRARRRTRARCWSTSARAHRPGARLAERRPGEVAVFLSTPNVLTLAPRARRARTTRGTCTSTAARSSSALPGALRVGSSCTASSTPASCAPTSWR